MAQRVVEQSREVDAAGGTRVARRTEVVDDTNVDRVETYREPVAERVVWFIAGVLLTILAFRFVLALLAANPINGFANFIYTISHPFVAPFFSLFGYNLHYGISRFETYTLFAMAVYALVAYGITRLLNLGRRDARARV